MTLVTKNMRERRERCSHAAAVPTAIPGLTLCPGIDDSGIPVGCGAHLERGIPLPWEVDLFEYLFTAYLREGLPPRAPS